MLKHLSLIVLELFLTFEANKMLLTLNILYVSTHNLPQKGLINLILTDLTFHNKKFAIRVYNDF
jgi:hypothetical protein